jgi:hypothetical protein
MKDIFDDRKSRASTWFRSLRDDIVAAFEALEDAQGGDAPAGRFEVSETRRSSEDGSDAGGGLMSVMRGGRVFEKVGVNVSTVYGQLGDRAVAAMSSRKNMDGLKDDPTFWASGISLVAHMQNPHVPAVHMNTRMFWTPGVVVRRRVGPQPRHRVRRGHGAFPCGPEGSLRPASARLLRPVQGLGGRVFLRPAPASRAGGRRDLLRRSEHRRLGRGFRLHAGRGARLPARLRAVRGEAAAHRMDRGRPRGATGASRALCRIQPRLRPGHEIRAGDRPRRECRSDEPAAHREVDVTGRI